MITLFIPAQQANNGSLSLLTNILLYRVCYILTKRKNKCMFWKDWIRHYTHLTFIFRLFTSVFIDRYPRVLIRIGFQCSSFIEVKDDLFSGRSFACIKIIQIMTLLAIPQQCLKILISVINYKMWEALKM